MHVIHVSMNREGPTFAVRKRGRIFVALGNGGPLTDAQLRNVANLFLIPPTEAVEFRDPVTDELWASLHPSA